MARFTITQTQASDSWFWECTNNPSINGFARSKKEARQRARENCRDGEANITPPPVDYIVVDGVMTEFTFENLVGDEVTFYASEIPEDIFLYVFGYDKTDSDLLSKEDVIIAILKIWGVFKSGGTDVLANHNLSEAQGDILFESTWQSIILEISDDETEYSWTFNGR
ncbi:MAG: hypothetical protein J6T59_02160 [Bacteroidales bacterium]|nr:hypothetical protein [Bacteroidales bacterium]